MSILPNVFTDEALRARQTTLDATWKSLRAAYTICDYTPDAAFAEFTTDFAGWLAFYDSGSDWSDDSKHATDTWQSKAQEWSNKLRSWGCTGNNDQWAQSGSSGIPSVKDNPEDEAPWYQPLVDAKNDIEDRAATVGYVAVGIIVLVVLVVGWIFTRGKASGYGVSIGGDS